MNYPPIPLSIQLFSVLLYFFCSMVGYGLGFLFLLFWVSTYAIGMKGNAFYEEKLKAFQLTVSKKRTTLLIFKSVIR